MKLLTRTTIYFFVIALAIFSLGGFIFFNQMHDINRGDAMERLHGEKDKILGYVKEHNALPVNQLMLGDSVSFEKAEHPVHEHMGRFFTRNKQEDEEEMWRTISFPVSVNNQQYEATIYRPVIEQDDIIAGIIETTAIIVGCLMVILLLANYFISRIIWKPFYVILNRVSTFNLSKNNQIESTKTNTAEFNVLNEELVAMTRKIVADYNTLKQYTENASHELQTPLAVIMSKLELMMQEENLSSKQIDELQIVYESAGRLSKLNQALILLTRIENNQFPDVKAVDIDKVVLSKLNVFEELIRYKSITVEQHIQTLQLQMHPVLADILVGNLIGNAIKHNVNEGKLAVFIVQNRLEVKNTGPAPGIQPDKMFERFSKANPGSDSLGLGLAIVKEICQLYNFKISYTYADGMHSITVSI